MPSRGWRSGRDEPRGLKELDRRLSRVETALAWLLAAAWLCSVILVAIVARAVLAQAPAAEHRIGLVEYYR